MSLRWLSGPLWHHAGFRRLWAAQSLSAVGGRVTRTAVPVVAVLSVDGTPLELGLLSAISVGPAALVGLFAGGAIDRSRKRPLLIGADLVRALLVLTVPAAAWLGQLSMTQLYLVAAAIGCGNALFEITDNAYLPALVGRAHLVEANAKLETTESLAEIVGPGLAGVLIDLVTAPVAMVVDGASYLWSALLLGTIRAPEQPAPAHPEDSLARDLRQGFQACWREPRVRSLLLATAVATLAAGFFFALYMLYTLDVLGLSPGAVGLIISVGGVGALLGALTSRSLASRFGTGRAMVVCLVLCEASALLIPLARGPQWLVVTLLVTHQLVGDAVYVAYWIQAVSLRQAALPGDLLARGNALFTVTSSTLLPLGAVFAGVAGDMLGVRTAIWIGVSSGLLAPVMLLPLWRGYGRVAAADLDRADA